MAGNPKDPPPLDLTIPDRQTFIVTHPAVCDGKTQTTYRWCAQRYDK
ncbi:hypothetical protein [Microvirga lotononidis]|nr:hypothetical protein [Microvirga lotononidis]WQO31060.1 hypothetical protein U0023_32645 [Microvirga lotononidis]